MRWKMGHYCFDDSSNELFSVRYLSAQHLSAEHSSAEHSSAEHSILLEPKASAMLHYFVRNVGKNITRDQLIEAVWSNQVVSENAINRIIVQLRKALNDSEKVKRYIVTVPKLGYRFIADCSQLEEDHLTASEVQNTNDKIVSDRMISNRRVGRLLIFSFLVIATGLYFGNQYLQTGTLIGTGSGFGSVSSSTSSGHFSPNVSPVTRFSEIEFGAELAHDNQQLVYTIWNDNGQNSLMYRASVNSQPIRISQLDGNASNPHWNLDDSQIIYLFKNQTSCEFHLINFDNGQPSLPKAIYYCPLDSDSQIVFTRDKNKIVFTEKKSWFSPYIIYELDMKDANKKRIIQPVAKGRGNYYLDYDPLSDDLLLLNGSRVGKSSVFALSMAKQTFTKLVDLDYAIDSAIWGHAANTIVHPGIHPSYHLIQTNILNGTSQTLLSDSRRIGSPKRINNSKDYLFTSYLFNRDITLTGDLPTGINSAVMDYIPAISHDEKYIAFISKRTGYSQVWLYTRENETLTVFDDHNDGRMYYSLDWSFDNKKLLLNSSMGLMILNFETLSVEQEISPSSPSYASSWYSDTEISYSIFENEKWLVQHYDLEAKTTQALEENWAFVISNNKDRIYIDQTMAMIQSGQPKNHQELCGPVINRFSFSIRFNDNGFYCPAKDNSNDLLHIDNNNELFRMENAVYQVPFYSLSKSLIANIELKNSVSDIMRTNF